MQSLLGKLNHAATVLWPGRGFLKLGYVLLQSKPHMPAMHHINLSKAFRRDLRFFLQFLTNLGPVAIPHAIKDYSRIAFDCQLYTDASKSGLGIFFYPHWAYLPLPDSLTHHTIDFLEALALASAFTTFSKLLQGRQILCFVDNTGVQLAFQNKLTKKLETQNLIRSSLLWAATHRSYFFTRYIPTQLNVFADTLSRLKIARFRALAAERHLNINHQPSKFQLASFA